MSLDVYLELPPTEPVEVYRANITHNLNTMAKAAGLYEVLWRPDELGFTRAYELIPLLTEGLAQLVARPEYFKTFNPKNGWGEYEGLCGFVEEYLRECRNYPHARVTVSR